MMREENVMPAFSKAEHGFRHTLDSALQALAALGIPPQRITVRMAGAGWPTRSVVAQHPPAGAALTSDQMIMLTIAGSSVFHDLPVGMWERGSEAELGTQALLEQFDDPLWKAKHWIREGALLFDIRPDNLPACSRWIALFGLEPARWPQDRWYELALLMPSLHRLAGTERGIRLALEILLDLPLEAIHRLPNTVFLRRSQCSFLGFQNSRLAVDTIVGDRRDDLARWEVAIGPVELAIWERYQQPQYQVQLQAALNLVMPCYQSFQVAWTVLDARFPVRLGSRTGNGILAVNSWLGSQRQGAAV